VWYGMDALGRINGEASKAACGLIGITT
jgi:hypothetical protein